jgi:hypothetical protein
MNDTDDVINRKYLEQHDSGQMRIVYGVARAARPRPF